MTLLVLVFTFLVLVLLGLPLFPSLMLVSPLTPGVCVFLTPLLVLVLLRMLEVFVFFTRLDALVFFTLLEVLGFFTTLEVLGFFTTDPPLPRSTLPGREVTAGGEGLGLLAGRELEDGWPGATVFVTVTVRTLCDRSNSEAK